MNCILLSLVRAILQYEQVGKLLWAEALLAATYVTSRVPSGILLSNKTPHHLWKRHEPTLSHVRVLVSKCWYLVLTKATQNL